MQSPTATSRRYRMRKPASSQHTSRVYQTVTHDLIGLIDQTLLKWVSKTRPLGPTIYVTHPPTPHSLRKLSAFFRCPYPFSSTSLVPVGTRSFQLFPRDLFRRHRCYQHCRRPGYQLHNWSGMSSASSGVSSSMSSGEISSLSSIIGSGVSSIIGSGVSSIVSSNVSNSVGSNASSNASNILLLISHWMFIVSIKFDRVCKLVDISM